MRIPDTPNNNAPLDDVKAPQLKLPPQTSLSPTSADAERNMFQAPQGFGSGKTDLKPKKPEQKKPEQKPKPITERVNEEYPWRDLIPPPEN